MADGSVSVPEAGVGSESNSYDRIVGGKFRKTLQELHKPI